MEKNITIGHSEVINENYNKFKINFCYQKIKDFKKQEEDFLC